METTDGSLQPSAKSIRLVAWTVVATCALLSLQDLSGFFGRTEWIVPKDQEELATNLDPVADGVCAPKKLPPVHVNSSWMGNQWVPPPDYRIYSALEFQFFFRNQSILWIGDSTARRTYGTLYQILTESHPEDLTVNDINRPEVIDMNKGNRYLENCTKLGYKLCRHHTLNQTYDLMNVVCLSELQDIFQNQSSVLWNDISDYTLIVIAIGPWELMHKCGRTSKSQWETTARTFMQHLVTVQPSHARIVWRTWGSVSRPLTDDSKYTLDMAQKYNAIAMAEIDRYDESLNELDTNHSTSRLSRVSYVDWGTVMIPRSFPDDRRIVGDMGPHYGLEARIAFLQMLINHLVDRERRDTGLPCEEHGNMRIE